MCLSGVVLSWACRMCSMFVTMLFRPFLVVQEVVSEVGIMQRYSGVGRSDLAASTQKVHSWHCWY